MMARRVVVWGFVVMLCAGCSPWDAWGGKKAPVERSGFIRDTARVVSVDNGLGQAVLDLHGEQIRAFWETQTSFAQGGIIAQPDATGLKGPVGQYKEPAVKHQVFAANPGDTISFIGMWTGKQIFLRSIAVKEK